MIFDWCTYLTWVLTWHLVEAYLLSRRGTLFTFGKILVNTWHQEYYRIRWLVLSFFKAFQRFFLHATKHELRTIICISYFCQENLLFCYEERANNRLHFFWPLLLFSIKLVAMWGPLMEVECAFGLHPSDKPNNLSLSWLPQKKCKIPPNIL